jgi:hypothetical protein
MKKAVRQVKLYLAFAVSSLSAGCKAVMDRDAAQQLKDLASK